MFPLELRFINSSHVRDGLQLRHHHARSDSSFVSVATPRAPQLDTPCDEASDEYSDQPKIACVTIASV